MAAQPKKKVIKRKKSSGRKAPVKSFDSKVKQYTFTHYEEFIFSRNQYIYSGIGVLLIILGMFIMNGGHMPDDETWDPNIIYSFSRVTLAPILILGGLILQVVAIFKK